MVGRRFRKGVTINYGFAALVVLLGVLVFGVYLGNLSYSSVVSPGMPASRVAPRVADRVFATYARSVGEVATIQRPGAIAVNASGWVYVVDKGALCVRVFDPGGIFSFQFNSGTLQGIAINASTGHIYALQGNSVQVHDAAGQWLFGWGSTGSGEGQFSGPRDLTVNGSGYVYVADTLNYRVQVFSPLGVYIAQWGSYGETREDQFEDLYGIATNMSGHVYVSDGTNYSIKVFTTTGQFIQRWGEYGSAAGRLNYNNGIAINGSGHVFVMDTGNERVQVFDQCGQFVRKWGSEGSDPGQFLEAHKIALNTSGSVFVVDRDNYRVQVFDEIGALTGNLGKSAADPGSLNGAEGVAVNSTGAIYVSDWWNNRVQVFSPEGMYLFHWFVSRPKALAINASDFVYVSGSTAGAPAEVFSPAGTFLYSFGIGVLDGACEDIAINASGCVFVTGSARISVFGPEGAHLYTFGNPGWGDDQLSSNVMGVAIAPGGMVHVTNYYRVKVFTLTGTYVRCYARDLGSGTGGFSDVLGRVRVDAAGIAYVVDAGAGRVSAFAPYGALAGEWGSGGGGEGQFLSPKGILVNASGHVLVTDTSRVQLFSTVRISRPARPVWAYAARDNVSGLVTLRWNEVGGAISYRVYRSSGLRIFTDMTLVNTTADLSASDAQLSPDQYQYVITAWNGYEESEPSDPKRLVVPPDLTPAYVAGIAGSSGGVAAIGIFLYRRRARKTLRT